MSRIRAIFRQEKDEVASSAIMGVCSYLANRFKLDVLAVRVSVVALAYFSSTSKVILAYIVVGIVLSVSGEEVKKYKKKRKGKKKTTKVDIEITADEPYESPAEEIDTYATSKVPRLSRSSVKQLDRCVKRLDSRVSNLETCLTSSHFQMAREFRDLGQEPKKTTAV